MSNQQKIDLKEFIAELKRKGLTSSSHFYVYIPNFGTKYDVSLCEATSLPGYTIGQSETRIYGEFVEMPHAPMYSNMNLTFLVDASMQTKLSMESWIKEVINPKTRAIGYYADYTRDVDIFATDKAGKVIYAVRLYESWPKSIGEIPLSYTTSDAMRLPVQLVYKWWNRLDLDSDGNPVEVIIEQKQEQNRYETNGIRTGVTEDGEVPTGLIQTDDQVFSSASIEENLDQFGQSVGPQFHRQSNALVEAVNQNQTLNLPENLQAKKDLIMQSKSIARDMANYGKSLTELGNQLRTDVQQPIQNMSTSLGQLQTTLSTMNSAFSALGVGSPFQSTIAKIASTSAAISTVANLKGLPGHMSNVGTSMQTTSHVFGQQVSGMQQAAGGDTAIGNAIKQIQEQFSKIGNGTSNAAAALEESSIGE